MNLKITKPEKLLLQNQITVEEIQIKTKTKNGFVVLCRAHSSEIRGLCLMKYSKFSILLEYKNPCSFFSFSFRVILFSPQ